MRRLIVLAVLGMLFLPVSSFAQYENTPADQMVREWYSRFLRRDPDPGSAMWVDPLKAGQSPDLILSQILASTEYYIRGGSTSQGFVEQLYTDLTGRRPGPRELEFWMHQLQRSDRQNVAYAMLRRYPQNYGAGSPGAYPSDPYDYRRPYYRPYRR